MFHILGYNRTTTATDVNAEMTAAVDPSFSQRNGHYIFTEQYQLFAAMAVGLNITEQRLNMPTINAVGFHNFWGIQQAAVPTAPFVIQDLRSSPLLLPTNEEMSVQVSDGVIQQSNMFAWISPQPWTRQIPSGLARLTVRATSAAVKGLQSWGAFANLVFESTLKGGWYSMVGAECVEAASSAFQVNFPRQPLINGRKLFPGGIVYQAIGNLPLFYDKSWAGWMGTFHTFEPPQVAIWANAAGAGAETWFFDLIFHGDTPPAGAVSSTNV